MDDQILFQIGCILIVIHLYKDVNNPFTFVGCIYGPYGTYNIDVQYFKTCHNILENKMTTSPWIEMTLYCISCVNMFHNNKIMGGLGVSMEIKPFITATYVRYSKQMYIINHRLIVLTH